ncbi:hypothetical protein Fleli_0266 [Bernardetia litoralis DSM 6794]|uniref:CdiI immunity protein domain-containing protein n=1 Tax=Bernardetia litoralis (strain ATCC 23117 / DSM 6794 / NBRC 15988 / NCIMB 1366 / Fx l1 / Sio-4) TaxID=880071 RepID=I4AFM0_BERLS|nr:hypothetical protein [Bernardetia litoralis]AFM02749.1 hypothetical protein Fleli_0260 [Bernardetia litoralis DSM 6794]AFM02755.1 hypothetical protein Fleli_0266 [Bernardetia litoralis DSM 6794]
MKLSEKYPEEYFNHWIAMFCANNSEFNNDAIIEQIEMYKSFEGEEEFSELKAELNSIIENDDLDKFIEIGKNFGWKEIKTDDLINMTQIIRKE